MESTLRHVAVLPLAYLLGAFPTGYLVVYAFRRIDVRRIGSGRTGGTNVLRSAGPVPAILTVLGDGLKGGLAVLLARALAGTPLALALAGVAAILGHNHSVFLGWRGGAGTIISIGIALFINPIVGAVAIVAGSVCLAVSRYASLASILVALVLPLSFAAGARWWGLPHEYWQYSALGGLISLVELRPNICRLLAGTERKVGQSIKLTSSASR